jgi:RecA-family ATPase
MDKLAPKLIRRAEKAEYKAVIIDPIYKVLTGDENNAHDMSLFVNQFDLIATELKCSVIYAHHHSKGSQGGKASMDRSSGSGVFARDPDAILDLIELPVDEPRYDQRENEAICSVYQSAIKHFNSNYEIPLDDTFSLKQMSHHLLTALTGLPNSKQILKQINERKNAAVTAIRQATAWRLSGTLREFPKFDPVNAWFQYPIHVLDDSLQDIKLDDDQKTKWKKGTQKANQSKSEKSQQELEEAFNILSMDGGAIEVNKIADYLEVSKRAVYNRIKKSKKFSADGGMIEKTNNNDK